MLCFCLLRNANYCIVYIPLWTIRHEGKKRRHFRLFWADGVKSFLFWHRQRILLKVRSLLKILLIAFFFPSACVSYACECDLLVRLFSTKPTVRYFGSPFQRRKMFISVAAVSIGRSVGRFCLTLPTETIYQTGRSLTFLLLLQLVGSLRLFAMGQAASALQ